jgi:hypothetical protein
MLTVLLAMACGVFEGSGLPDHAVAVRAQLAEALVERDPSVVGPLAEKASEWEGKDGDLDRLLGDALANVLMHPQDGLRLLRSRPDPGNSSWVEAIKAASVRMGDPVVMKATWAELGERVPSFDNPVVPQLVQQLLSDPALASDRAVAGIDGCALLDQQPSVGRKELDHRAGPGLLKVGAMMGADQVVVGRPLYRSDPDPQTGRGPLQCVRKVLLEDGWPEPLSRTLTVGLRQGQRKVFIDIKGDNGEPWAYAASDQVAGGRMLRALDLLGSEQGEEQLRAMLERGLWAVDAAGAP